ncbi:tetratricopeptide repeat protein, partial [Escherichia fergusonii]|uniref:tetratricopeptide repeat protein n=1 Tax=Escherichia fergusonii TaxID=564 RepID=UPI0015D8BE3C
VKYELGALYFRLGSYEMAKRYFKEALASPDIDSITKERIEPYLPDTEKQLQPSRFSGFAQTGIRSQSNASFAPGGGVL